MKKGLERFLTRRLEGCCWGRLTCQLRDDDDEEDLRSGGVSCALLCEHYIVNIN